MHDYLKLTTRDWTNINVTKQLSYIDFTKFVQIEIAF